MTHHEGTFQRYGGVDLYYQAWRSESPSLAVLVLVHGFGEHGGRYGNVVGTLVPEQMSVYAFDHRGHGRSPGKRGHISSWHEYRSDLDAFVSFVAKAMPRLPLFVWGHSMGGLIVLEWALRNNLSLSGVIASAPVLEQVKVSPILRLLSRLFSRIWPSLTLEVGLDTTALSRDPSVVRAYETDPLVHGRGSARLGTEMDRAIAWTQDHAPDWALPLLILHGDADRISPPDSSLRFFERIVSEDKQRRVIADGYHEPHNDTDHAQTVASVVEWLMQHRRAINAV